MPTGTVTLLFSDMEGSTRLLARLGDQYVEALDAQRAILRRAWADHDGYELGTEGDSFYVAFSTADHAVNAVAEAQQALNGFVWPGDTSVRVRMGLHTGEPIPHDGAYVGIDVHRAARISAAAHGGQIVVSSSTASLVSGSLPAGTRLRDLGDHRLKDLESLEHVYQLDVDGLPNSFPPLRSLGASSTLPALDFPTVGRDRELVRLSDLVSGGTRLLTLTGPGGAGKTTLAIALAELVADRFPGGVYFAPLAAVTDEDAMWSTIAESTGFPASDRDADTVCAGFESRKAMFVLDNLEQLPAAADEVRRLLAASSHVVVVATSRRPLHLSAEQEFDVGPLAVPDAESAGHDAHESPSIQLFVNQARRVLPTFALTEDNVGDVVAICRRLDGMPLGIELAAARCKLLSPRSVLSRLNSALDLSAATVDLPARHRTLRDTIAWSYNLLGGQHQAMFETLGVFADGADLDAAAAVARPDDIGAADPVDLILDLVDASLARISDDEFGEPRVTQLETVREFARELLLSGPRGAEVTRRHARHFTAFGTAVAKGASAPRSRDETIARLERDRENYVAVLEWAFADASDDGNDEERVDLGLSLLANVVRFWAAGSLTEGIEWLERGIGRATGRVNSTVARCMATLANFYRFSGDSDRSYEWASRALAMARDLGGDVQSMSYILRTVAVASLEVGRGDEGRALANEAVVVARGEDDYGLLHYALWEAGWHALTHRDLERSRALMEEARDLAVEHGSLVDELDTRHSLAKIVRYAGRLVEAEAAMRWGISQAVAICDEFDLVSPADDYAALLADLGRPLDAARLFGAANAWYASKDMARGPQGDIDTLPPLDAARASVAPVDWQAAYEAGSATPLRDALIDAVRASGESPPT
ncbi:MAG TPA: adenylate/guanylate cyclase domain-containing protein [Nocardioidaceae bacterium]|nr:adenylate/guanylate cyclase domain-containing protein [Nocardioidaceae bacterium]